jgi:hypothetical protein
MFGWSPQTPPGATTITVGRQETTTAATRAIEPTQASFHGFIERLLRISRDGDRRFRGIVTTCFAPSCPSISPW